MCQRRDCSIKAFEEIITKTFPQTNDRQNNSNNNFENIHVAQGLWSHMQIIKISGRFRFDLLENKVKDNILKPEFQRTQKKNTAEGIRTGLSSELRQSRKECRQSLNNCWKEKQTTGLESIKEEISKMKVKHKLCQRLIRRKFCVFRSPFRLRNHIQKEQPDNQDLGSTLKKT